MSTRFEDKGKSAIKTHQKSIKSVFGLYFDGRNDLTLVKENNKTVTKRQQHISLVQQPGNLYIGHVTPNGYGSETLSQEILEYCSKHSISLDDLVAVGCDGCPENTGRFGGIIKHIEEKIGHSVQWIICLLHFNGINKEAFEEFNQIS